MVVTTSAVLNPSLMSCAQNEIKKKLRVGGNFIGGKYHHSANKVPHIRSTSPYYCSGFISPPPFPPTLHMLHQRTHSSLNKSLCWTYEARATSTPHIKAFSHRVPVTCQSRVTWICRLSFSMLQSTLEHLMLGKYMLCVFPITEKRMSWPEVRPCRT